MTAAKLEHEGHQLTPVEVREMERVIKADIVRRDRFREMMRSPLLTKVLTDCFCGVVG